MCKVECDSKTCLNYKNGICGLETLKITNHEYWDEKEKEFNDIERCGSYKKNPQWT